MCVATLRERRKQPRLMMLASSRSRTTLMPIATRWGLALTCAALLHSAAAHAENTGVPYASLYQALAPGLQLVDYPRLAAVQRITSKRADVAPQQIKVWINSPEGRIEVPVAADGQVRFPMRQELIQAAATVSSNQPRGSLSVSLSFEVVPPQSALWTWSEFGESIAQARAALSQLEGEQRGAELAGIEFRMPAAGDSLTVETASGEDLMPANDRGQIVLRWDEHLPAASTRIHFSRPPVQALPYLRAVPR